MKTKYSILLLVSLTFLGQSCKSDDEMQMSFNEGLLEKVELYVNTNVLDETTIIEYNSDQRIQSILFSKGNFLSTQYEITYTGDQVNTLTINTDFLNSGNSTVDNFDVSYTNNQIDLIASNSNRKYSITTTDNYIDSFRQYFGDNNQYYYDVIFTRNAENNIDTIRHYSTDAAFTDFLIWEYAYSDFDNTVELNSAFNPVYYYSHGFYDSKIGLALGLQISNQPPLHSTYWDSSDNYRENNVMAEITSANAQQLIEMDYLLENSPGNSYNLQFEYY